MRYRILSWIKGHLGLVINDTDMTSYLLLKVDYHMQLISEMQETIDLLRERLDITEDDMDSVKDQLKERSL
jgi:hypothetical protein|tara:strand:+ start:1073 stop:1285 length:213 start_codon:yes stop_codon:yes gene_type:complete